MSDINKFTSKEVLNKVLLDSSGNAVNAFSHTTQEALNAALDATNNRLNVSLAGGTISGDVTISGDLTVTGGGGFAYTEVISASDSGSSYTQYTNSTTGSGATDGTVFGIGGGEQALIWNYESTSILFGTADTTALTIDSSQNATFGGDVTVSGGDMTLTGATTSIIGEQSAGANRGKIKFVTSSSDGDIVFETTTNGAGAITEAGRFTHEGHLTLAQNINLGDDKALTLGSDSDAQIWNDGSNTYVRNNTSDQDIIFQVK